VSTRAKVRKDHVCMQGGSIFVGCLISVDEVYMVSYMQACRNGPVSFSFCFSHGR